MKNHVDILSIYFNFENQIYTKVQSNKIRLSEFFQTEISILNVPLRENSGKVM
jgi:hypothetical protein